MVIRTGILSVPEPDDQAVGMVRQQLQQHVPGVIFVLESSAPSQRHWLEELLRRWCDEEELDLVITIGGTLPAPGPSADEIVPEATLAVIERLLPGLPEAMRAYAQAESELALLDRGVAGIRGRSLLLNLPAGAAPALLFLAAVTAVLAPIIAHLQDEAGAPRLVDVLEIAQGAARDDKPAFAQPSPDSDTGLNAEEFAAFLQRGASGANTAS